MSNKEKEGIGSGYPVKIFKGVPEELRMNTWHFLYVIREMQLKRKGIKIEHSFVALSFSIALFLSMLPSDYKDFLGVSASVWQWLTLTFAILSLIAFVVLLVIWLITREKEKTPEDILADVKLKMVRENEELANDEQKRNLALKMVDSK